MFKVLKKSKRIQPKLSLILLDWSVRESFHICHYLKNQTTDRDQFEIVVVEYYSKPTDAVNHFQEEIDTLAVLGMPKDCYYHKHLMYNIGFFLTQGDIIVICDSDAMVKPTFIHSILEFFKKNPNHILHLDQFRNCRTDLYPFSYPNFEEVTGPGCLNYHEGKTTGVVDVADPLHQRNYGSCFCCTRADYLAIGGSDEHIDFVGHICGPYDLTFRLINFGKKEVWHQKEFLYHTWHPGSDGIGEYMGPHDGYNLSTTSLSALWSSRVKPHVRHPLIAKLQRGKTLTLSDLSKEAVNTTHKKVTKLSFLKSSKDYAQKTYCFPLIQPNHFSKWKQLQFIFTFIFKKIYALFFKKIPLFFKLITRTNKQIHQEWRAINHGTSNHLHLWHTICHLYADKKTHYLLVNSQRDLLILSQLILWKRKMTIQSHQHLEVLNLNDLTNKQTEQLLKNGNKANLHLTPTAQFDWKKNEKLNKLEFSTL